MSSLTKKLAEYEDFELAFIVAFKKDLIATSVNNQVQEEVISRKLSQEYMDKMVQEKLAIDIRDHDKKICPRCTSKKILKNKEEFHGNNKAFGLDSGKPLTAIEYQVCGVCGWNFLVDETDYERKKRRTSVSISIVLLVLLVLLMTYVLHWATS